MHSLREDRFRRTPRLRDSENSKPASRCSRLPSAPPAARRWHSRYPQSRTAPARRANTPHLPPRKILLRWLSHRHPKRTQSHRVRGLPSRLGAAALVPAHPGICRNKSTPPPRPRRAEIACPLPRLLERYSVAGCPNGTASAARRTTDHLSRPPLAAKFRRASLRASARGLDRDNTGKTNRNWVLAAARRQPTLLRAPRR